ncbi:MAG TPA: TonB-dependent receptor [Bacteroidales bacterium]|nr:TonB-dependent receptor [Bacteroidales bacterium]
MKYIIIIFSLIILYTQNSFSQSDGEFLVEGTVIEAGSEEPIEMASATLLNPEDSTIVMGTISDTSGHFEMKPPAGNYLLSVKFVSHKTAYIPGILITDANPKYDAGIIYLATDSKKLSGIEITGERSYMSMEGGKKIFNVGRDLSTSGASAIDVLENIPAVSVDIEGNISLRGSSGVRVLVNGKPSSMMGLTGSEALDYFPANQIKRVEVITNPSAKYEAQGSGGIINIILKDNKKQGLNGSLSTELGEPKDHGVALNMNYRKNWFNVFGSYNFNVDRSPGGGWNEQTFSFPDTTFSLRTDTDRSRGGENHNFQFGSDFYLSQKDMIRASGVYSFSDQDNYTDIVYRDYTGDNFSDADLALISKRNELEKEDESDYEFNLSYEHVFDKEKHKLTADFQARSSIETEDANLVETSGPDASTQDTSLFQESLNDTDVKAYLAKIDYVYPFSEEGKFEAGFRGEIREINNEYFVKQRETEADPFELLDPFSNTFFYEENIFGAYAMLGNEAGVFNYQAGLRLEYTGISTYLKTETSKNDRSYFDLFPSASISYNFSELNSVQLSYSRRLNRPYFRRLNPFGTFNDDRNYRTGNPELDPEYTGAFDFGYIHNEKDKSFYLGAYYRRTVNDVERVDTVNNEGITISKPFNLASRNNAGIETRYNSDITDWWDFSISSYFYRGETKGEAAGEDLNAITYTMSAQATMDFDVKNWFEFQVTADYRAPEKEGQDTEKSMTELNLGIRKSLFNDKGNISFSARNLFNLDAYESSSIGNNFTSRRYFQWRSGTFYSLSFSYKLKGNGNGTSYQ